MPADGQLMPLWHCLRVDVKSILAFKHLTLKSIRLSMFVHLVCFVKDLNNFSSRITAFRQLSSLSTQSATQYCLNMSSERGQALWLSDDLWANIFSLRKTKPTFADGLIQNLHPTHAKRVRRHQEFHKLRLVCKRFQRIFEEHVDLSSCLFLDESNSVERLPSALQWLQRCHNSVEHAIMACGTPVADVVLGALVSPEAKLSTAVLCKLSRSAISVLSTFTSLTFCELIAPHDTPLDLGPLHALSGLSILHLKAGIFRGVGHLAHLSSLHLSEAVAYVQANQLAPDTTVIPVPLEALQKLSLTESKLLGLQAHGVSIFTSLQSLKCHCSIIEANSISDCMCTMANHYTHLPSNLAALTCLTRVCVVIRSRVYGTFQLHWVQAIPGLEHLDLSFLSRCSRVEFDKGFTCLSKLKTLSVSGPGHNYMDCTLALMTPWESMLSLEELRFSAQELQFGKNILGLSKLQHIKCLFLRVQGVMDAATSKWLAALTQVMATKRPQVWCMFGNEDDRNIGSDMANEFDPDD